MRFLRKLAWYFQIFSVQYILFIKNLSVFFLKKRLKSKEISLKWPQLYLILLLKRKIINRSINCARKKKSNESTSWAKFVSDAWKKAKEFMQIRHKACFFFFLRLCNYLSDGVEVTRREMRSDRTVCDRAQEWRVSSTFTSRQTSECPYCMLLIIYCWVILGLLMC